jgi:hypothetical protein
LSLVALAIVAQAGIALHFSHANVFCCHGYEVCAPVGFIASGTEGDAAMYLEILRGMLSIEGPAPASAFPGMAYPEAVNPKSTRRSGAATPKELPRAQ